MTRSLRIIALLALIAASTFAAADTVTYNGGVFGLQLIAQSGDTYTFRYTADFTGWESSNQQYIDAINFGTGGNPDIVSAVLIGTNAGDISAWLANVTNANNGGCSGGNANEVCLQSNPTDQILTSGTYYWDVSITYTGTLSADNLQNAPIRAWFGPVKPNGNGAGLLSDNVNIKVPEPATFAMLGFGLVGLIGYRRMQR